MKTNLIYKLLNLYYLCITFLSEEAAPEAVLILPVNNKHCDLQLQTVPCRWKTDKLWPQLMDIG